MSPPGVQRKLAAILAADVAGYARLMGEDEEATLARLTADRREMSGNIASHGGRIVNAAGDALLAEFASVVEAVACAAEMQSLLAERNRERAVPERLEFRVGVHLGDVLIEGDDIFGDGVNIAARLQALADPGGVCLSGTVYDSVHNKLEFAYYSLGEQAFKNIAEPVRAYRLRADGGGERAAEGSADRRDSIAVLPFNNLSADPEQEYFSDGISEDLITALSKLPQLNVIARHSAFAYKGKPTDIKQVSRELGARHVLEGSVRKAGGRVRISAQLVDGVTGAHVWAERYDRDLVDIFAVQDEVTREIVAALRMTLSPHQQARLARRDTANIDAYDYLLRGRDYLSRFTREANGRAGGMFEQARALDPDYAPAYAGLSLTYMRECNQGWSAEPEAARDRSLELAEQAVALDGSLAAAHETLSYA